MSGLWLALCLTALAAALWMTWKANPLARFAARLTAVSAKRRAPSVTPSTAPNASPTTAPGADVRHVQEGGGGWLKVLPASQLFELVKAERTLAKMMRESRVAPEVWRRDLAQAITQYAEIVQLLPASEAHHHAHAGGLLAHTLEVLLAAMTWRNGLYFPQGAGAEQIDVERDHWTYVVFFAALLHDIGKILADLKVTWKSKPVSVEETRWMPVAGSLSECGAKLYFVGFTPKQERDYTAHQRMSVLLFQRVAPESARGFMAQKPHALQNLLRFLSGEDKDSPLAQLVRKADQASTARALASGSRVRFTTASSMPLIDLLMGAMREMLRRGSVLPLNRDGAAGWVANGSLWFVAKRLADEVRNHLKLHAPDEPLPGDGKNDRLFDTWQEYGCIEPNPVTGQSVWYVRVHGKDGDGYSHQLTMLRFPLDRLWDSVDQYPAPMKGTIEVLPPRSAKADSNAAPTAEAAQDAGEKSEAGPTEDGPADAAPAAESAPAGAGNPPEVAPAIAIHADQLEPVISARTAAPASRRAEVRAPALRIQKKPAPAGGGEQRTAPVVAVRQPAQAGPANEATRVALDQADGEKPVNLGPVDSPPDRGPVSLSKTVAVLTGPELPQVPGQAPKKPTPALAMEFMRWLLEGLRTRAITYNEVGAPVHFVELGMALVSPLIFREFARQHPEAVDSSLAADKLGNDVQREVLKAGWHLQAAAGTNIHQFSVVKRGGIRTGRLSAVVLMNPSRWVHPVPPPNPSLALPEPDQVGATGA